MKCPLCANTDLVVLSEKLRRGAGRVVYCKPCQLGLLESGDTADLVAYYAAEYWKSHGPSIDKQSSFAELFDAYVDYQGRRLTLMTQLLTPETRLLEVGCATGQFLFNVKPLVREAIGVDYDTGAAAYAAERTGCKTFGGGLANADLREDYFDVVCAFQTLEHVPDPLAFLKELSRYLGPGGHIVLEVPSLGDPLLALYDIESYAGFFYHNEHQLYFTPVSLTKTLGIAGFEGEIHFVQDYNLTNHMNWVHRQAPQPTCHHGLGLPNLPLHPALAEAQRASFNRWLQAADQSYREMLAEIGLTENITFIGRRRGEV